MLTVACSCGVTFLRWVTPEQAADELVMSDFATWMSRDQYPSTPAPSPADVGATIQPVVEDGHRADEPCQRRGEGRGNSCGGREWRDLFVAPPHVDGQRDARHGERVEDGERPLRGR